MNATSIIKSWLLEDGSHRKVIQEKVDTLGVDELAEFIEEYVEEVKGTVNFNEQAQMFNDLLNEGIDQVYWLGIAIEFKVLISN